MKLDKEEWAECPYDYMAHEKALEKLEASHRPDPNQLSYHRVRIERCYDWLHMRPSNDN